MCILSGFFISFNRETNMRKLVIMKLYRFFDWILSYKYRKNIFDQVTQ